jgi:hypothetical protein
LDVGTDQIFDNVEQAFIVGQSAKLNIDLAHLHNLQHLLAGLVFLFQFVSVVDRQIAKVNLPGARQCKGAVILTAQQVDLRIIEHFAYLHKAITPETINLRLR